MRTPGTRPGSLLHTLALACFLCFFALACQDNTDSERADATSSPDAMEPDTGDVPADAAGDVGAPGDLGDVEEADATPPPQDAAEDAAVDGGSDQGDADAPPDLPPEDMEAPDAADQGPDADADMEPELPPGFVRILGVEPDVGPVDGGTQVVLTLAGQVQAPRVQFAGRDAASVEPGPGGTLVVVTPPGSPGLADIKLVGDDGEDTLRGGFRYIEPLELESLEPAQGSTAGGSFVLLRGRSFSPQTVVSFGARGAVQVDFIDEHTLEVITPEGPPGPVDVRVSDDRSADALRGAYTYLAPVQVDRLYPAAGPRRGGDVLILSGQGLREDSEVWFGAVQAQVTHINDQRLEVVAPPGPAGPVDVAVINAFGADGLPRGYTYLDEDQPGVVLATVAPLVGPDAGGQELLLSGQGLDGDNLEVWFGEQPALLVEISDRVLRVRTPPHAPGVVDITVRHDGGAATLEQGYTYLRQLRLLGVEPGQGDISGGQAVTVSGAGFTAQTRFFFGPLEAAAVQLQSPELATMVTPPGSLGWSRVRAVEAPQEAALEQGFLYEDNRARAQSLSPRRGSIAGGTLLTIRGRGFWGEPTVSVGGQPCAQVQVLDQATLTCRTPPGREGSVPVQVHLPELSLEVAERYTYYHPGTRFGGSWGEGVEGAVNVSVFSIAGGPVPGAFVMLTVDGDTQYQGFTNEEGLITFSGEDVLGSQFVSATAAGFSSATLQEVNAENISLLLFPTAPPSGGGGGGSLPLATITGTVAGFQKIAQPGPGERQVIIVETTRVSPERANPWPGNGNVVDPNGSRIYTLTSRVGDVAVVAWGGLINDQTGVFTPYALGVRRYLFVSQNETYEVDLELNIELTRPLRIKLTGAHTGEPGPTINRVTPWIDLGFEGVFGGYDWAEGASDTIVAQHQAPLVEELADATYILEGGSWTNRGSAPYAISRLSEVTRLDGLIEMPTLIGTPMPLIPEADGAAQDGYVAFEPLTHHRPDVWHIQLYQLPATLVWEVTLPGDVTWFHLPRFPDFSDLPAEARPTPYAYNGELYMLVTGARIEDFDYNNHEYLNQLRGRDGWISWTRNSWFLRLD